MQEAFLELVEHVERVREEWERVRKHETYIWSAIPTAIPAGRLCTGALSWVG